MIYKGFDSVVDDVDERGIVTVYANAFNNTDADGDISQMGSFTKTINEFFTRVKWFLNHDKTILLGVPIEAIEDDFGLKVRGQLNMKKRISQDILEDYKLYAQHNKTLEHSIGVTAINRDKNNNSIVTEWKWWEYSTLTSWGANERTPLVDIKSYKQKEVEDTIDWLEKTLSGKYTDERLKSIEQNIKSLKTLIEPPHSTQKAEFNAANYLKNNLTLLKNG